MNHYDVIVIGAGGWGSAALHHLARRGLKVCAIDQFSAGHDRGSSHGDSRIIRMAYFMHPDYVPALQRTYELWRQLETECGEELLKQTGLLCIGEPEGPFIRGLEQCYATHLLAHERLSPAEAMGRFPQFSIPAGAACYWDPYGGFLRPEACTRAHRRGAEMAGGETFDDEPVLSLEHDGHSVRVRTVRRTLHAAKVVLAAGAFTNRLLGPHGANPIQAVRKVLFWYGVEAAERFVAERFPCWIAKLNGRNFYGFPTLDGETVKAAEDTGGQLLHDAEAGPRELLEEDEENLQPFMQQLFPGAVQGRARYKTCLYEQTVDRHFLVDYHPTLPNCVVAAGGSGHGFKFSAYIGEVVADLIETGSLARRPELFAARGRLDNTWAGQQEPATPATEAA